MRPLLQHASRSLTANVASVALSSTRPIRNSVRQAPSICLRCQYRAASTLRGSNTRQFSSEVLARWSRRSFSSSTRRLEEKGSSSPSRTIPLPPPASEPRSAATGRAEDRAPELVSSLEGQERLQEDPDALLEDRLNSVKASIAPKTAPEGRPAPKSEQQPQTSTSHLKEEDVADNIARVPDEHLPSHRERQRWDFSKRLSELMDELLPKLAVVTQKVNTYTGTDYSGVEALRREIMEQGNWHLLHVSCTTDSGQRNSSKPAELPLTPQNRRSTLRMPDRPLHRRKSSLCSSASTHGPPPISNDTCPSFALNT